MEFLRLVWSQSLERQSAPEWWIPLLAIGCALPMVRIRRTLESHCT